MKKHFISMCLGVTLGSAAVAQNLGVDYFLTEQFDKAKEIFESKLGENPAESNYYLGEIAYASGDTALARSCYEKGLAADPEYPLNKVGLAKFLLKADQKTGIKTLTDISKEKASKKNVAVQVAIAKIYYENGMTAMYEKALSAAEKANKKSPLVPMLRGDILKLADDVGGAAGEYEQAINLDESYLVPYIKAAQIYADINPSFAIEKLTTVLEIDSSYPLTNRYMARALYNVGHYARAIDIHEKSFNINVSSIGELTDYAAALFFSQRYDEAAALIDKGLTKDSRDFVLNRLRMYSALEQQDYVNGLPIAEKFFALPLEKNKYIPRDYTTYGDILSFNRQIDAAVQQYGKAIELATDKLDMYKKIGEQLNKAGYPGVGADYYNLYIEAMGGEADTKDYYTMGTYLYKAATTIVRDTTVDSLYAANKANEYLVKADTTFGVITERMPDNTLGFLYRARVNASLDPETSTGLAKPHYEALLALIVSKENYNQAYRKELLEIYQYLSYYYYLQFDANGNDEDKSQVITYSDKILELNPNNAIAQQLKEALSATPEKK
ncbi:MAG: tetratricopeptide repeat protein [Prevotellaceae bacterium]|jgi:predicted negative regulator of RcsB-dependent stress response|nr:tetratricopeptide repeat protein [Prevotellaceae bacterium]